MLGRPKALSHFLYQKSSESCQIRQSFRTASVLLNKINLWESFYVLSTCFIKKFLSPTMLQSREIKELNYGNFQQNVKPTHHANNIQDKLT